MKFPQLQVGQRFEFQGENFLKTGPLTANEEVTGKNRLIMKSALVTPLGNAHPVIEPERKMHYSRAEVEALFIDYRARLEKVFEEQAAAWGDLSVEQVIGTLHDLKLRLD